jgi:hypothetical protein
MKRKVNILIIITAVIFDCFVFGSVRSYQRDRNAFQGRNDSLRLFAVIMQYNCCYSTLEYSINVWQHLKLYCTVRTFYLLKYRTRRQKKQP